MTLQNITLIITATLVALIAGLFYSYSCSVNLGLGKLGDKEYINAMQSINREILNPVFFASFMGAVFLLPASAWFEYREGVTGCFWLLLSATLIYWTGTFGVTIFGNVPLNEAVDKFDLTSASITEIVNRRKAFEIPWNMFNTVRTIASIIALILVIIACIIRPVKTII